MNAEGAEERERERERVRGWQSEGVGEVRTRATRRAQSLTSRASLWFRSVKWCERQSSVLSRSAFDTAQPACSSITICPLSTHA
eukprot:4878467-Pleurochrysis_carterae.AAC.1